MIASYLAATIALTMITGVALAQSPSPTTASPYSSTPDPTLGSTISERSTQRAFPGNGIVGQFWTSVRVQPPKQSDDGPKTIEVVQPMVDTASQ
jgi:hypothetical protein